MSDTPSRRKVFICRPTSPADEIPCARKILSSLASEAYRRTPSNEDVESLMEFYGDGAQGPRLRGGHQGGAAGAAGEPEVRVPLREHADAWPRPGQTYRISDIDLASRLSFFLWNTVPDAELVKVATAGTLHTPAVLEKQVRRMLADPRAESLSTRFASQWLRLQDVEKIHPDALLFPGFDNELAESYKRETELFFDSIVREDRNILDLLTADYTFVNERIARVYRMPNIVGENFRRVTVPDERRGILGQGSMLMQTAVADRTSPVQRGKWIMEVLLGSPPPPPPDRRAAARRHQGGDRDRQAAVDARAHGRAPQEPGVPVVPQGDRSARAGARELRHARRVAHQGQRRRHRLQRRALRRHQADRPGRSAPGAAEPLGSADPQLHRQPDVVRDRPPHRVLRSADDSRDREEGGAERQSLLVVRPGHRQQSGLPDEHRGSRHDNRCNRGRQCTFRRSTSPGAPS